SIFSDEQLEYPDKCESITLTKCKNIYEEVECVAKKILDLTSKQGIRYREISVISRDANSYNEVLKEIFEKYSIPLFVDSREGVENLNLFRLVSFALSAVAKNLDNESVISLVKTGLAGVDDESASLFELYTYVWRVNKKDFTKPFDMPVNSFVSGDEKYLCDVAKQIEEAREKIINPLVKFNKEKGNSVKSYIRAIYNLLNDYSCSVYLKKQADDFAKNGYMRLSDNTVRSYDIMIHILDQLYLSLGENEMSLKRFCDVFESAVTLLDVGSLPQGLDAVAAGSAERMRPKAPKVTFIIGANEGVFPSSAAGKGLFSDSELIRLKDKGITLPFYDVETAVDEQYLAYCALCSPSEKLYVSYYEYDIEGNEKEPSVIVENLCSLFPKLNLKKFDKKEIYSEYDALKIYALSKGEDEEIKRYFEENPNKHFESLKLARLDKLTNITKDTASELYGKNIYTSASKIEVYNKCPFSYFCKYGIKANAIKEIKIDNLIRGSIVHEVLEKMLNEYTAKEFFELSFEQAYAKVEELADAYQTQNSPVINKTPVEKYRFKKLCNMIVKLVTKVFSE
ncbi:MAG: exodeoxyribonuclease V subunit gamma, partial [Clostridia bacterium]|nr:exodeoxyribonuclease V subunit gamma [Clostridia bacterium]